MLKKTAFSLVLSTSLSFSAFAGSVNTEPVGGFSSNGLAPTSLIFSAGSNQILGTNGSTAVGGVRDYVTFTVPAGLYIGAIYMLNTTPLGSIGFIGIEAGNQLTLATNVSTADGLLGWRHYVPADIGTNILPFMSVPNNGSSGFSTLGPGAYSLWIQDSSSSTASGPFNYGFDVQLVPEPSTWAVSLAALAGLALLIRRRNGSAAARQAIRR